ncbi:protein ORF4 [Lake sturgeon herpesvirus]|nr:protein ORF4 [Lake sturgeon herpesvirus]
MDLKSSVAAQMFKDHHDRKLPIYPALSIKPHLPAGYKHGALLAQECYVMLKSMFDKAPHCSNLYTLWLDGLQKLNSPNQSLSLPDQSLSDHDYHFGHRLGRRRHRHRHHDHPDTSCNISHLKNIQASLQDLCICWPHAKIDRRVFKTPVPNSGYTSMEAVNLAYLLLDVAWSHVVTPLDPAACGPTDMIDSDQLFKAARECIEEVCRRHVSHFVNPREEYLIFLAACPEFNTNAPTSFNNKQLNILIGNIQDMAQVCLGTELFKQEMKKLQYETDQPGLFVTDREIEELLKAAAQLRMFCHRMAPTNFMAKRGLKYLSRFRCKQIDYNVNYTGKTVWMNKLMMLKLCQLMM